MTSNNTQAIEPCPACESNDIDCSVDSLDGVCTQCGYVIQTNAEREPSDWLVPQDEVKQSACQSWDEFCPVRNATEQQLVQALSTLEKISDRLTLGSELRRESAEVYCEAFLAKTTDGRDTECLVPACVRLASLECEYPVPTGRLTETSDVGVKQFRLSYTALCEDLDTTPSMVVPADYIPFLAGQLTLADAQREKSIQRLANVAEDPSLVGKNPVGIASGAVYLTTGRLTQSDVAEVAGLSTETVRQRVAQLRELVSDA